MELLLAAAILALVVAALLPPDQPSSRDARMARAERRHGRRFMRAATRNDTLRGWLRNADGVDAHDWARWDRKHGGRR